MSRAADWERLTHELPRLLIKPTMYAKMLEIKEEYGMTANGVHRKLIELGLEHTYGRGWDDELS